MALKQYDEEFALMLYELQKDSVLYEHGLRAQSLWLDFLVCA